MRGIGAGLAVLVAMAAPVGAQTSPITIVAEGFSIGFPGSPEIGETSEVPPGVRDGHHYELIIPTGSFVVRVGQFDPAGRGPAELVPRAAENVVRDCAVRSDETQEDASRTMRALTADCANGVVFARVAAKDGYFYEMTAHTDAAAVDEGRRFAESFTLLDEPSPWTLFESVDGFAVEVPGTLIKVESLNGIPIPPAYRLFHRGGTFEGFVVALPPEMAARPPETVLDQFVATSTASCRLVSQADLVIAGGVGREVTAACANRIDRGRLYLVDGTAFGVAATGPEAFVASADADRFLNTFKVVRP